MAQLVNNFYIRYFFKLVSMNLMNSAEYRSSLFVSMIGSFGYTFFVLIFLETIAGMFGDVAGWNKYELLVGFSSMQFVFNIWLMFFRYIDDLPAEIFDGKIDQILLRPINALYNISIRRMDIVSALPGFILQIFIFLYALDNLNISPDIVTSFLYIYSIVISTFIFQLFFTASYFLAFWITEPLIVTRTFMTMFEGFSRYPKNIYPDSIRWFFLTVFPTGLMAYVPTMFILSGFSLELFLLQLGVFVFFCLLSITLWHFGIRRYSGASS